MSKLIRVPTFGIVTSRKRLPLLVSTKEIQQRMVNGLFLTEKKTREIYKLLNTR